jgi:hypothetical protein
VEAFAAASLDLGGGLARRLVARQKGADLLVVMTNGTLDRAQVSDGELDVGPRWSKRGMACLGTGNSRWWINSVRSAGCSGGVSGLGTAASNFKFDMGPVFFSFS